MFKVKSSLISLSLALLALSCSSITVESTKFCTVRGVIKAGAVCNETLKENETILTMDQLFDMLEPQLEEKDAKGKVIKKARGGAVIQSAEDFTKNKTAMEKACYLLGDMCDYDMKKALNTVNMNYQGIQAKSLKAAKEMK